MSAKAPSERAVEDLVATNAARVAHLGAEGLQVAGRDLLVRDVFLEHILRWLGGDQAVLDCRFDIETRIAEQLDEAEKQLPLARRLRAAQLLGVPPGAA